MHCSEADSHAQAESAGGLVSSVLVVVVLLGMWAFVLVPLVRQRNVKADEARSVARFSSALRVLSRGHSFSDRGGWAQRRGMRQWVIPPREGLAAARLRRVSGEGRGPRSVAGSAGQPSAGDAGAIAGSAGLARAGRFSVRQPSAGRAGAGQLSGAIRPSVGRAAARRRRMITWLAVAVMVTLLLVLAVSRLFLIVGLPADASFVVGLLACRSAAAREGRAAARHRRRRETVALRASLASVERPSPLSHAAGVGSSGRLHVAAESDGWSDQNRSLAVPDGWRDDDWSLDAPATTVPLDAPAQPRRAVPTVSSGVEAVAPVVDPSPVAGDFPVASASPYGAGDGLSRRVAEAGRTTAHRVPPSRPRAEPVVLAEIDLDWEPAVPEPASGVRLIDGVARHPRLFDESPADGVDVGDDAELDALVQRRLAASGW